MKNETLFKAICEMVKQFDNIKDEDKYREKCIQTVLNTFNIYDYYKAEVLFDLALYWEGYYLTDEEYPIQYKIENKWDYFKATKDEPTTIKKCLEFRPTPNLVQWKQEWNIMDILVQLDKIEKD